MSLLAILCRWRGYHRSNRRPPVMCAGLDQMTGAIITRTLLRFTCRCGAEAWRNVDATRGGRIPIPFRWPLESRNARRSA